MAAPLTLGAATRGEEEDDCNRPGVGAVSNEGRKDCILEPLSLPERPSGSPTQAGSPPVPCAFCEEHFPAAEQDQLLKHMVIEHKMVIADVKLVADFRRYILYWRKRFSEQPITDFCSVIRINSTAPLEEQDNYFLLCDVLPEDRVLREELQKQKLRGILEQQQQERSDDSFRGVCMFCDEEFLGNRSVLLNHMSREHAFNIGLPDNIVNCSEFLRTLQKKLDNLQCLYCEKTFRDKNALRDHMRKRRHRRVNPRNREYDRFYVINYLPPPALCCHTGMQSETRSRPPLTRTHSLHLPGPGCFCQGDQPTIRVIFPKTCRVLMTREHSGNDANFPLKGTEDTNKVSPECKCPKREECVPEAPALRTAWDMPSGTGTMTHAVSLRKTVPNTDGMELEESEGPAWLSIISVSSHTPSMTVFNWKNNCF